jgi:pimeloyl-ACP methyl ester carboxylesterase
VVGQYQQKVVNLVGKLNHTSMSITNKIANLSRRSFILARIAGALAALWPFFPAHGQQTTGNINFRDTGTQSPTVIFVHGFSCALEDWDALVNELSPKFRCIALDLPGHGASAAPAMVSISSMAAAVNQVKDLVGPGPKILVGHSMGCRVIMEAYLQSHDDVAGLVFVDGSIVGGDPETGINRAKETVRAGIDLFTENLFNDNMFVKGGDPALNKRIVARAKKVDPKLREELFVDMIRWDLTRASDALKQITVPVLVLQSTYFNSELKRVPLQEGMTTPWMDSVAVRVPKSQAKVVPNAGHFAIIEAARTISGEIGKFSAEVAKGRRQVVQDK